MIIHHVMASYFVFVLENIGLLDQISSNKKQKLAMAAELENSLYGASMQWWIDKIFFFFFLYRRIFLENPRITCYIGWLRGITPYRSNLLYQLIRSNYCLYILFFHMSIQTQMSEHPISSFFFNHISSNWSSHFLASWSQIASNLDPLKVRLKTILPSNTIYR